MNDGLDTLERDFLAGVRDGDPRGILERIAEGGTAPKATRLEIYVNAYRSRLREALEADHPQLGRYLGDEGWEQLCDGYIAAHPSRYRSLRHFGTHLPDWLAITAPFHAHPEIAELAAFERRLLDVFDAADSELIAWIAMLALPGSAWPGLRLRFHPSVQLFRSRHGGVTIWQALKEELELPSDPAEESVWLLWRDDSNITRFRSLDHSEDAALSAFFDGADFADLCEDLAARHPPDFVPGIALGLLQRWFDDGLVARIDTPGPAL